MKNVVKNTREIYNYTISKLRKIDYLSDHSAVEMVNYHVYVPISFVITRRIFIHLL